MTVSARGEASMRSRSTVSVYANASLV